MRHYEHTLSIAAHYVIYMRMAADIFHYFRQVAAIIYWPYADGATPAMPPPRRHCRCYAAYAILLLLHYATRRCHYA